ncbi:MAG: Cna B-type domain-containing protein [Clostridiaceae bacterium]|nr:Cna B-type domain-containing protein [Clostridiaceae bacterium]
MNRRKTRKKGLLKSITTMILLLSLIFQLTNLGTFVHANSIDGTESISTEITTDSEETIESDYQEKSEIIEESTSIETTEDSSDSIVEESKEIENTIDTESITENNDKVQAETEGRDISSMFPSAKIINSVKFYLNGSEVDGEINATTDDVLKVVYNWSIPNSILNTDELKEGDYIEIDQPQGISPIVSSGSLGDYGSFSFVDGKLRLTFNSKIETDENIEGTVEFTQTIKTYTETGKKEIIVPISGEEGKIIINVKPKGGSSISKTTSGITNDNKVLWEVSVNTEMNEIQAGATVKDILPNGLTLDNIKIYEQEIDLNGNVIKRGKEATGVSIEDSTIIFDGTQGNKSYIIIYETFFDEEVIPADGGELRFENIAEFTNGDQPIEARATAKRTYEKFVIKSDSRENSESWGHIYDWSIRFNNNSKKLPAGVWVQDEMPVNSDSTIIQESIKVYTADGKELDSSYYTITHENDRNFRVTFNEEIDFKVEIKYQTKFNGIISSGDDRLTFKNNVTTSEGFESEGIGRITEQGLSKWVSAINYDTREVTWTIEVNRAMYYMENWSLVDTFSVGQTYVDNSFEISEFEKDEYDLLLKDDGFEISLKAPTSKRFSIRYKTKFEPFELPTKNGISQVINVASHKWIDENGNEHEATRGASHDIKSEFVIDSNKSGSYNARTKEITWRVITNYRQEKLVDASIVDTIQVPQEYVTGSAKLVEVSINPDGSITFGDEVLNADIKEPNGADKTVVVNLPEGSIKTYALIFNTSLKDHVIKNPYVNKALYTNDGREQEITARVSVANEGNHLEKQSKLKETNRITWELMINKSQSTIKDLVIEDNPSNNQIINKDSIKIYNAIAANDNSGNFNKGDEADIDFEIDLVMDNDTGEQTLTIKFNEDIHTSYIIEYVSDVIPTNDTGSESITNSVKLTGSGTEMIETETEIDEVVITSGGTGQGETTTITFEKVDSENTDLKLSGVKLELWSTRNGQKNVKLREGITDENGRVSFGGLRTETDYLLFEILAGEGYTISEELLNGMNIKITKNTEAGTIIQVANELSMISFRKVASNNNQGLENAEFNIKKDNKYYAGLDNNREVIWEESETKALVFRSDSDGLVVIRGLDEGEYKIVEIKAPEGYERVEEEILLNVVRNENGTLGLSEEIADIVNQRIEKISISISKIWDDENNQDGIRPNDIKVNLLADGEVSKEIKLSEENNWEYTFVDLPKFNSNDDEIAYDVQELDVEGYESIIESEDNTFQITNKHNPIMIDIEGIKTWDDNNNQDGKRPESITIRLLADGQEIDSIIVSSESEWGYKFEELPKFKNGKEIIYSINEDEVQDYVSEVNGFDITNIHIPEKIKVSGQKIWDDAENQDGKRPDSITVRLYANGEEIRSIDVTSETNWKYEFDELSKYDSGKEIKYTISEDDVEFYETEITGFDIVNKHSPELIEIGGTKTWDDNNNEAKQRPKFIEIELYKTHNGETIKITDIKVKPNNKGEWVYSFESLPKYEDGEILVYSIKEKSVDNYVSKIDGFDLENKYTPPVETPSVPKDGVLPKTGVSMFSEMYLLLLGSAMIVLGAVLVTKRRKHN